MTRVLFVCMGNICRSPTAEGVFKRLAEAEGLADEVAVDSAGTHGYHLGEPPDRRTQEAARRRGYDLSCQRARRLAPADFADFDLILAMDRENLEILMRLCPEPYRSKVGLFMTYARNFDEREVPDPYFGGAEGFERVLDMVEDAARGLVQALRRG